MHRCRQRALCHHRRLPAGHTHSRSQSICSLPLLIVVVLSTSMPFWQAAQELGLHTRTYLYYLSKEQRQPVLVVSRKRLPNWRLVPGTCRALNCSKAHVGTTDIAVDKHTSQHC
jgi:hypothetical protein